MGFHKTDRVIALDGVYKGKFCPVADDPDEVHMSKLGETTIRNLAEG